MQANRTKLRLPCSSCSSAIWPGEKELGAVEMCSSWGWLLVGVESAATRNCLCVRHGSLHCSVLEAAPTLDAAVLLLSTPSYVNPVRQSGPIR